MLPRELGACANSVYQALFPPPPHKSLGTRLRLSLCRVGRFHPGDVYQVWCQSSCSAHSYNAILPSSSLVPKPSPMQLPIACSTLGESLEMRLIKQYMQT